MKEQLKIFYDATPKKAKSAYEAIKEKVEVAIYVGIGEIAILYNGNKW